MDKKINIKGIREVARATKNIDTFLREFGFILYDPKEQLVFFEGIFGNDFRNCAFSKTEYQEYMVEKPMTMKEIKLMILGRY